MKFYKYWARADEPLELTRQSVLVTAYGASNANRSAALADAQQRVRKLADGIRSGDVPDKYLYADRPVREEIVEAFGDDDNPYAIISRNAYGALVLNTARVLFADVDLPRQPSVNPLQPLLGLFGRLFGGAVPAAEETGPDDIVTRVKTLVSQSPGIGLRLYRTAAGCRCLVTSQEYDPLGADSQQLLASLESDPLYVKLCQVQECFRARLTPKFWRCGCEAPPVRFPWADDEQQQQMRQWEQTYNRICEDFATCELVECLGNREVPAPIDTIVALHDRLCCQAGLPLA